MEELRIFLNSLSSDEQRMFACECGTSIGYLRKALSKGQVLGASLFEVDDDATPDEIHDEAKEIFFNYCNYSYHEIKDEEEEQNG